MRGLAFNLINIEDSRTYKDTNQIKVIKQLRKDSAILKPDKSNGVVLLNSKDCTKSVGNLFEDNKKIKTLESDPTITRMKTLQRTARIVSKYGVFSGPYFSVFGLNMKIYSSVTSARYISGMS